MLFSACTEVLSRNINDTVSINIKANFDLWNTSHSRCDTIELEKTKLLVISCELTLTLENINLNLCLVISSSWENLALLYRNSCISVDNLCHNSALCLNTKWKRCNIEEEKTFNITAENTSLKCSTDSNALIRVNALEWLFADKSLNSVLNSRDSWRTTNHKNLVDFADRKTWIRECLTNRAHCAFYEVSSKLVELCSCKSEVKVLRTCCISCDIWKVDSCWSNAGKLNLSLFSCFLQSLHSHFIAWKVNAWFALEAWDKPINDSLIEVITAKTVVTGCCENFLNTVAHLDDRYIECTTAEVINHNLLVCFLINAIWKSSSSRLIDDTLNFKTSNLTSVLSCLTLCVCKVSRNCNNSLCYCIAKICFCISLKLLKNHSGNFLWSKALAVNVYFISSTHFSLDRWDCSVWVCDSLTLSDLTYHSFTVLSESYDRWSSSCTLSISDNDWFAAFDNSYTRVCST